MEENRTAEGTETLEQNTAGIGSQIKTLGKESLIYGISTVLARFLNFFLTPFYTYFLPTGEYGIIAGTYSYIAFMNILFHYALDQAYMRHSQNRATAFSAAIKFQAGTTAFFTFILCVFASYWARLGGIPENCVYYASAILVLDTVTLIPFADLRMRHESKKFALVKSAGITVNALLNVLLIAVFHYGIEAVFVANIVASLLQAIVLIPEFRVFSMKNLPGTGSIIKAMLAYAWPLFIAGAGTMIVQIFDRPVMLKVMTASDVGIYQASVKLGIFMQLLVNMFDTAWRAFVIERIGRPGAEQIFAKVFTYFTAAGLAAWLFLSFFTGDIVQLKIYGKSLFGPKYWGALNLLPAFFGANLLYGIYVNLLAPVIITKKTWISLVVTIISSLISIAGNIYLIPRAGMKGGAAALLVSYAVMCVLMFIMGRKVYKIPYEFRKITVITAAAALCFIPGYLISGPWSLLTRILCSVAFPALIWFTGFFSREEKENISVFIKEKYGGKLKRIFCHQPPRTTGSQQNRTARKIKRG
ncbi:MAG: polysaccharide biosynthesis C-terminal domain-containing protein [Elusimicrobiales bacterium]|nr:polysaccharide biosynthesis C-terminal domain-containing protein [Elusimicrobiales bacterium]